MRIAVCSENGEVFQHFGHTPEFLVCEVADGKIVSSGIVSSGDIGHGALAGLLDEHKVDLLICGGIGGGAMAALAAAGVEVIGGVSGNAKEAIESYLAGTLSPRADFKCNHHHHEAGHSCADHHHDMTNQERFSLCRTARTSGRQLMREICYFTAAIAIAGRFAAAGAVEFDWSDTNSVWVAGHRADWKLAPENSIASFRHAIEYGVQIIETDVRETKDGEIVIHHDATVDRMTRSSGAIAEMTLAEVKSLWLHDALGQRTDEKIPTLREYMQEAKGKAMLYLDKAGLSGGALIPKLLAIARETGTIEDTIFVLDWPYAKASAVFGEDLQRVVYCPVIDDSIPNLNAYVDEWLEKAKPKVFQFRMKTLESQTYAQLPKILATGSRAFIAATWSSHTAGHDDRVSLLVSPSDGWGWLVDKGFTIIETNFPRELVSYLKRKEFD